jgi:hypothetical protein
MSRYNQDTRHSNPSFSLSAFSIHEQIQILIIKKPAHPGNKSPERLALNSSAHFPLRWERFAFLGLASDHARSRLVMGEACYRPINITRRKCVKTVVSRELSEGEFSSILASLLVFLPSLDYLVRSRQHVRRNREADLLGGFEVDA